MFLNHSNIEAVPNKRQPGDSAGKTNQASIFERVLREKFVTFFGEGNNLLNANQHGFRSKISRPKQLLENYDTILISVEEGIILISYILTLQKHLIRSIMGSYAII